MKKGQHMVKLNSELLRRAADLSDEIEQKTAELEQLLAGQTLPTANARKVSRPVKTASGRRFTPESIEKIRQAQRRRWRKVHKAAKASEAAPAAAAPAPVAVAPVPAPAPAAPVKKGQLVAA